MATKWLLLPCSFFLNFFALSASAQTYGKPVDFDQWTGLYLSKDKKMVATIEKKLAKEADLFTPAQYTYILELNDDKKPYVVAQFPLQLDTNENILWGREDGECDDPGCTFFNSEVKVKQSSEKAKPKLTISFDWFTYADELNNNEGQGSGSRVALRAFSGTEEPLPTFEKLTDDRLKTLIYAATKKEIENLRSYYNFSIAASLEETEFAIYKKAFLPNETLSAMFISIKTQYLFAEKVSPAHCVSLLTYDKKDWNIAYLLCTQGNWDMHKLPI